MLGLGYCPRTARGGGAVDLSLFLDIILSYTDIVTKHSVALRASILHFVAKYVSSQK